MGFNGNLILYACIAKETIILAEFNAKDHPDLGLLALKCLEKTPFFHSVFSHTIRGKTYMFLIQEPFTYFAIYDENLENPDGLAFLDSVKEAFGAFAKDGLNNKSLDGLVAHCFQGEFNPVFHQLLTVSGEMRVQNLAKFGPERTSSMDSTKRTGKVPLLEGHGEMMTLKPKKKRRFLDDLLWMRKGKDRGERKVDVCDDDDDDSSMQSSNNNNNCGFIRNQSGLLGSVDPVIFQRQAKKSWQKHVWIVLSLDLIICLILFSVWLWVCSGFKCIDG